MHTSGRGVSPRVATATSAPGDVEAHGTPPTTARLCRPRCRLWWTVRLLAGCEAIDHSDGTYSLRALSTVAGAWSVHVFLNGRPAMQPWPYLVRPGPADPATSELAVGATKGIIGRWVPLRALGWPRLPHLWCPLSPLAGGCRCACSRVTRTATYATARGLGRRWRRARAWAATAASRLWCLVARGVDFLR